MAFKNVPALMENIAGVTRFLAQEEPDIRRVLTVVKTHDGQDFYQDGMGEYWRVYYFVTDSLCLEKAESPEDFKRSGEAFGRFQRQLAGYPAHSLYETIKDFHNIPARYQQLHEAVRLDVKGRVKDVQAELDFILAREERAGTLKRMQAEGQLLTRVTHNDTKLNNVLLDTQSREPLCVIDLDTVMPGLVAFDFGASTAAEDELDLSKVTLSLPLFRVFAEGFLSQCGSSLNAHELRTLPEGAYAMTLECGVRFLTDYLSGDVYFRIHRERHNLDRCRTQFKLVADMETKWQQMEEIIRDISRTLTEQAG